MSPNTIALAGQTRLARGDDFTVADLPILALGVDARMVDALHAIGALLHDAAAAHGDVRVALARRGSACPSRRRAGS